jgi:hypothetical protein
LPWNCGWRCCRGGWGHVGQVELLDAVAGPIGVLTAAPAIRSTIQARQPPWRAATPPPPPLEATDRLNGDWLLLYTTSRELLNIDRLPLASLGPIYQCIRLAENRIYNIAEVDGPPLLSGLVAVAATLEPCRTGG